MKIRKSQLSETDIILEIYAGAKLFMQETGNKNQWVAGYPSKELILKDISNETSYVCIDNDEIVGVFCFIRGDDITYSKIYDGKWLNDEPYGVIHRLAGKRTGKGVAASCLQWCFEQCGNIKVDTHQDNIVMQKILKDNGYSQCGIIYLENGTQRIAFQKSFFFVKEKSSIFAP
jgi:RimJ/RimL family protein N-acetyltransferase